MCLASFSQYYVFVIHPFLFLVVDHSLSLSTVFHCINITTVFVSLAACGCVDREIQQQNLQTMLMDVQIGIMTLGNCTCYNLTILYLDVYVTQMRTCSSKGMSMAAIHRETSIGNRHLPQVMISQLDALLATACYVSGKTSLSLCPLPLHYLAQQMFQKCLLDEEQ